MAALPGVPREKEQTKDSGRLLDDHEDHKMEDDDDIDVYDDDIDVYDDNDST